MVTQTERKQVVVIGGGTGTYTVLRGLKRYHEQLDLTAIVTMADSGGSTGRLRDEFGCLPVGDARMALAALAADLDDHDELVRELFLYRFSKGNGLSGHNFGNLLLTALTEIVGGEKEAIAAAAKILRVRGRVVPVTEDNVHLQAVYDDGVVCVGEKDIDEPPQDRLARRITELSVTPRATLNPEVLDVLSAADLIVLGPGDLYTSVLANCVVDGFAAAISAAPAPLVHVCNLMTKAGQTTGMTAQEHVAEIERYCTRAVDHIVCNDAPLPEELLVRYEAEAEYPVVDGFAAADASRVYRRPLLAEETVSTVAGDVLRRSLIRHDPDRLAALLVSLVLGPGSAVQHIRE